jgi:hypothetical protein
MYIIACTEMQLFAEAETKMMAEAARKESEDVSQRTE